MYEDFDALLSAPLAAARLGTSRQMLNYWRTTGRLVVAERRGGHPMYRLRDLLVAEAATRRVRATA